MTINTRLRKIIKNPNFILKLFLLTGIGLRIIYYCYNRSLWIDEIYLSASIIEKDLGELLLEPLLYFQKAPLGFLFFQKLFYVVFSSAEFSLRIFPLMCGIAGLILFIPVAKHFLPPKISWLAVGLFALAPPLIYHSAEAKQYSTELLASVAILFLYCRYHTRPTSGNLWIFGIAGAVLIWFSYPVIFILAGIGLSLLVEAVNKKDKRSILVFGLTAMAWLFSFAINYFLFTYKHAKSEWTVYWFQSFGHFAPLVPHSLKDLIWYPLNIYRLMDYPLGLWWKTIGEGKGNLNFIFNMAWIPFLLLVAGTMSLRKQTIKAVVLFTPVLLVFFASGLKLYPLTERFWVFIAPIFILLIVEGCRFINMKFLNGSYRIILPMLLLVGPVMGSMQILIQPDSFIYKKASSQREALAFIDQHLQPLDRVYIYWNDMPGYRVYKKLYHYQFSSIKGKDFRWISRDFNEYINNLEKDMTTAKEGKRFWLVLNDTFQSDIGEAIDAPAWYFKGDNKPTNRVVEWLVKTYGKPVHVYKKFDVHVYCFETGKM